EIGPPEYRQQLDVPRRLFKSITENVDRTLGLSLLGIYVDDGSKGLAAVGLDRQRLEVRAEPMVHLALSYEFRSGHYERFMRVVGHALSRVDFGKFHADRCIRWVQVGYLLVSFQRFPGLA